MKQITLNAKIRTETGRSKNKQLRSEGGVPAVIYGEHGVKHLTLNSVAFATGQRKIAGSAALIELQIDGEDDSMFAIVQEAQRDACSDAYLHVDLKEVVRGRDMEAEIPVHTVGISRGVKNYGGVLEISADYLSVRCRPSNLPEFIEVNVRELDIGRSIHLSELVAPDGVTFLDDPELVVVACSGSTAAAAADEEDEAEAKEAAKEAKDAKDEAEAKKAAAEKKEAAGVAS